MAITSWPLVRRETVVQAFRPGRVSSAEAPFRTLRAHGWATPGVRVARRAGRHLAGQTTVFSSLNVEAARLARHGRGELAAEMTRAVESLEASPAFQRLAEILSKLPDELAQQVIDGSLDSEVPAELGEALRVVARCTERVRGSRPRSVSVVDMCAGRVTKVYEEYVILAGPAGPATAVPRWMAVAARREKVGEPLVLVTDKVDTASAFVEAVPAIEYEDCSVDPEFTPFGRGDSRVRQLSSADEALLAGDPEPLVIVVPVSIGE